jgi:hypothetical protein
VIAPIECAGAPRDLGLDQGRACRALLREACARSPLRERWGLPAAGRAARLARDLGRHFPHLAESLAGLAAGAGVPERWLLRRLATEPAGAEGASRAAGWAEGAAALLAVACAGAWIVRRSRPEGGFACLELTRPWRVAAFAGVNEAGLAAVSVPGRAPDGTCAAPAGLLAHDCLHRFSRVENALDWCSGRPAGRGAGLLFADAHGGLAGVEVRGDARRVLRPDAGRLVWADAGAACAELAKALGEPAPPSPDARARWLAAPVAAGGAVALLDPVGRRLAVPGAAPAAADWIPL